ncbi:MAG: hypothetical protein K2N26_05445 [Oscillospiraceae bacterium]|nr:hypothetical protein [Oscillospiraceae bacterium]MDE7279153.1 hypothetical protein [Oscillospiraceae bacterium]
MDNNEFSLDALLESSDFTPYESVKTRCAMNGLFDLITESVADEKTADLIQSAANGYGCYVFNDAFKQGFCFAIKSVKFLLKS